MVPQHSSTSCFSVDERTEPSQFNLKALGWGGNHQMGGWNMLRLVVCPKHLSWLWLSKIWEHIDGILKVNSSQVRACWWKIRLFRAYQILSKVMVKIKAQGVLPISSEDRICWSNPASSGCEKKSRARDPCPTTIHTSVAKWQSLNTWMRLSDAKLHLEKAAWSKRLRWKRNSFVSKAWCPNFQRKSLTRSGPCQLQIARKSGEGRS